MSIQPNNSQANQENKFELRPNTHSFDIDIAEEYDIEIAIMYKHITYLVNYNKKLNNNFYDGHYWFYNTLEEIAAHFPYWSKDQVFRILKKMTDLKLILKGNYNKTSMDRTVWYTINCKIDIAKSQNGNCEIATPIPNTNTNYINKKESIKEKDAHTLKIYVEREKEVRTTDDEHLKLEKELGKEVRDACYKILNEWKVQTPKHKWKKDDYLSIRKWVYDAYKEKQLKEKKLNNSNIETLSANRSLAIKIKTNFESNAKSKGIYIDICDDFIRFLVNNAEHDKVYFNANGFKEQIDNLMRKLRLI